MSLATLLFFVPLLVLVAICAVAPLRASLTHVLRQRTFLAAVVLLGVAAVGLNAATEALKLNFRKEAVPLSVPRLDDVKQGIPSKVGKWVQVTKDEPLDHGVQEVLGTKEFVFRDYVDSTLVDKADLDWFADKSTKERAAKLAEIQGKNPQAVVKLAITYYTGMVDTVPHVAEKCYVADGFEPTAPVTTQASLGHRADGSPIDVAYRHLHFRDSTGAGRVERDVAYLFHVNGRYESSSVGVRGELANLLQRYGYFAKIEVMTTTRGYSAGTEAESGAKPESLAAFNDLLAAVLPEVERCLPDWKKVTAKK
jgi:hypothetical protein